jgi:hypothetical protein
MISDEYLDYADLFRNLRNDFAHNLRVEYLGRISKKRRENIKSILKKYPTKSGVAPPEFSIRNLRKILDHFFIICSIGFELQRMNIEYFQWTIRRKEFAALMLKKWRQFQKKKPGFNN